MVGEKVEIFEKLSGLYGSPPYVPMYIFVSLFSFIKLSPNPKIIQFFQWQKLSLLLRELAMA